MAGVGARAISSSSLSLSLSLSNSAFSSSRPSLSLLGRCCCPSALLSLPITPSLSPSPFPFPSACHLPRLPVASPMRTLSTLASASLGLTAPSEPLLAEVDLCMSDINLMEWKGDILAVGVSTSDLSKDENGAFENTILRKLDGSLGGLLGAVVTEEDFSGKTGQSTFIRIPGSSFKRVGLIGLGKSDIISRQGVWKSFGEVVAGAIKTAQASSVAISVASNEELDSESAKARASSIAAGVVLGLHEDLRFKSETKKPSLKRLEFLGMGSNGLEIEETLKKTQKVCAGVILTRHLINAPPNVITPNALADEALNLASDFSDVLTTQIFDEEKCKELKMGAYLGVAAASDNPPKFIHMQYKPPHGDIQKKIAIIGKGLTFDSGGYNIKSGPGSMIELMKFDMGGAGAVFGAAKAIAAIRPLGVEVHFIVAACENMIGGKGMRPGDILTASNGKTIEVNNTDAEGRLTLADALVYACNQGVDKIVDLATLTGACIVGLGNDIAGLFTPNDDMANDLSKASMDAGEKLWRLPMEEAYWDMMKSGIADMVNTGGRAGGSITAALFLKQFVDPKVKWAHLDIAGPVWSEKKKSATGYGVATLVEWILAHAST